MTPDTLDKIKETILEIPDFPKPGILFKDIMPLFSNPILCLEIRDHIAKQFAHVNAIAGIESRGFFWGMSVAMHLKIPFIPIRKAGKLPGNTISESYTLEYGTATVEIQQDAIQSDWEVLIHDDLLATGGTANAAANLIRKVGKVAGFSFLVELKALEGRGQLLEFGKPIQAIVEYP